MARVARVALVVLTVVLTVAILAVAAARHAPGVRARRPDPGHEPDTGICLDVKIHEVKPLGEEAGRVFS